jgi:hypothetical protein
MKRGIFISKAYSGQVYVASRSHKSRTKLIWWTCPYEPTLPEVRIEENTVPEPIRRQAYRALAPC